jgi:hypothetical protein
MRYLTMLSKKAHAFFAFFLLFTSVAFAQVEAGLGALSGVVTDPSKALVAGAHVVLTNPSIGFRKEVTTNAAGAYSFSPLEVVSGYVLQVSAPGFTSTEVKSITTSVGTVFNQNVTLAVGVESTVVEVTGASEEQVQVDTSSISQLVDSAVWENSPLDVRSQNTFVGLVAGAAPDSAGTGRGFAINGARTGTGDFLTDGYDNNDQGLGGGAAGGAVATISPDAVLEFRVITSTPPAEYGRTGGFATDTVLKSGTSHLHGSAFDYNRVQAYTANNWFSDHNGLRDHLVRNQFGGSLGGKVYKDKTFVFVSAEFQRQSIGNPSSNIVATTSDFLNFVKSGAFEAFMEGTAMQNASTGQVGACPYNGVPTCPGLLARSATLGATFTKLYAQEPNAFPLATGNFSNVGQGLYTTGTVFPVNVYGTTAVSNYSKYSENRGTVKLDHRLTNRDELSFTYLADLGNSTYNDGGSDSSPGLPEFAVGGAQLFGATWEHTFSPTLINTFKASYLRHVNNIEVPDSADVPAVYAADSLYTGFGAATGLPQYFTENQFSYEDSVTKTIGRHSAKAGFVFRRTRNGSSFYNDVQGQVVPWSVEGLLTDGQSDADLDGTGVQPAQPFSYGVGGLYEATASLDPTTGGAPDPYRGYRANEFGAYAQDDFKFSSRLTVNYGLRWDYFGPPHNFKAGFDSNVYFGTATSTTPTGNPYLPNTPLAAGEQGATFQLAESNGRSTIWNRDTNNFAPRVGFALDTMGNQKFVIRGGFGVGFDRLYNNVYENIRFNAPHFVDNTYGYGSGNGTVITEAIRSAVESDPFTGNSAVAGTGAAVPRHIDQHLVTAYYEQAHLGFETALPKGFVFETDYILTLGRKLVGLENANTFPGRDACPVGTYTSSSKGQGLLCYEAGYPTGFSTARLSSAFANDNFRTNAFSSNYNGGQVSLRKGFSNGIQMLANYTYSKAMDETSDVFTIKSGATGITAPYNPSYDYGPADFDTRNLFVLTANYISHSETHKLLLAGWGFSPILSLQSGNPIDIIDGNSGYSPNKDGSYGVQRAVYTGTGSIKNSINHNISPADGYINPATGPNSWSSVANRTGYTCPVTVNYGLWCNPPVQRNSLTGPRLENLDLGVSKHLTFHERYSLTLQAAFFDIANHPEFSNPVGNTNNPSFGESTSATNRKGQVSARVDF